MLLLIMLLLLDDLLLVLVDSCHAKRPLVVTVVLTVAPWRQRLLVRPMRDGRVALDHRGVFVRVGVLDVVGRVRVHHDLVFGGAPFGAVCVPVQGCLARLNVCLMVPVASGRRRHVLVLSPRFVLVVWVVSEVLGTQPLSLVDEGVFVKLR